MNTSTLIVGAGPMGLTLARRNPPTPGRARAFEVFTRAILGCDGHCYQPARNPPRLGFDDAEDLMGFAMPDRPAP
jgi:hypothetical protein